MSLCDSERATQKGKRMLKSSRCDAVMPQCLILSQKVLKCHTWLPSLVDWITIRDPMAWHRWVTHFDMTLLLTSHLGIVSSHCCLEANVSQSSSIFPYFKSCHCRQVWQTNRSPSCNAEAAAAMFWLGPAVLWHELHFVRIWNEMSRISRVYCAACFKNL